MNGVREGMQVVDSDGNQIGTIESVSNDPGKDPFASVERSPTNFMTLFQIDIARVEGGMIHLTATKTEWLRSRDRGF